MKHTSKKIISIVLTVAMILTTMAFGISAADFDETWKAITNAAELKAVEDDMAGKYYLANDIKVSSSFQPIGWLDSGDTAFTGTFDGNGHTVSGLDIPSGGNTGLFAINEGTIKNLTVSDSEIVVSTQGGLIAGVNNESGVISNCTVSGSIISGEFQTSTSQKYWLKSGYQVGGVVGLNNGTVEKCVNDDTDVRGWYEVGGIVGHNSGTVSQCVATGYINSTNSGIAASAQETRFKYAAEATARFSAYTYGRAGGIAGYNNGTLENVVVSNAEGNKYIGIAGFNTVGGICGMNEGLISKACATNIQFTFPSNGATIYYPNGKVGGYAGTVYSWQNKYFHPIAATMQNGGTTEDCFYASVKSGTMPSASFTEGGRGQSCSSDDMKNEDLYKEAGWDFDNVWTLDPETQLPVLKFTACSHEWSDWKVTKEASCETTGTKTKTCSLCGATETETIPATGHEFGEWTVTKDATCGEDGAKTATCSKCDAEKTEAIPATGNHTIATKEENRIEATCNDEGSYELVTYCTVCGEELSRETIMVAKTEDHTPAEAVKENEVEATCTTEGSYDSVVYCSVCGKELSRETVTIQKAAHTPAEAVKENEVAATCDKDGSYDLVVKCSVCGEELSRETIAVAKTEDHTPAQAVKENEVEATCTTEGSYDSVVYCSVCGKELSRETVTTQKAAHTPSEWIIDSNASCSQGGRKHIECTVCKAVLEEETIPATGEHSYVDVVTEPTCTTEGYTTHTCSVCGNEYIDTYVEKIGHTASEAVKENEVEATCTSEGSYDSVVYCSVCGKELSRETVTVEKIAHTPAEAVKENEVAATCDKDGSYDLVVKCSVCGEELSRETITVAKTEDHTPAEAVKENEVEATCTSEGSYDSVVYCSVCGKELSRETVTVEKIAHTPAEAVKENEVAATCDKDGSYDLVVKCSVCGEELSRETIAVAKTDDHIPAEAVKENEAQATCTSEGSYDSVVYCSVCGKELSRETITVAKTAHVTETKNAKEATCTEAGYTGDKVCSVCGETVETGAEIAAKGHSDNDGDGVCDVCGAKLQSQDPSANCKHICHSKNIFGRIIWAIVRLICKIFKTNKVCSCGAIHY